MKKALALAAALTLALTLPTAAFAADKTLNENQTSGTADVTLDVMPSYSVTIPETIELKDEDKDGVYTATATVSASDVRLAEGYEVQVSMDSDFTMTELYSGNATEWKYQVTVGNDNTPLESEAVFATFTTPTGTDTEAQSVTLNFSAENPTYAGNYQETVTFKLAYVQA